MFPRRATRPGSARAKGWNRHKCDNTAILWRYEREKGKFIEVGRVAGPAGFERSTEAPDVRAQFIATALVAPAGACHEHHSEGYDRRDDNKPILHGS